MADSGIWKLEVWQADHVTELAVREDADAHELSPAIAADDLLWGEALHGALNHRFTGLRYGFIRHDRLACNALYHESSNLAESTALACWELLHLQPLDEKVALVGSDQGRVVFMRRGGGQPIGE